LHAGGSATEGAPDNLIQGRNLITNLAGLDFFCLGLGGLFLPHQGADLLGHAVALGLELLDFVNGGAALFIQREHLGDLRVVAGAARREPFPHKVRALADGFDVEHRRSIGRRSGAASWKGRQRWDSPH